MKEKNPFTEITSYLNLLKKKYDFKLFMYNND